MESNIELRVLSRDAQEQNSSALNKHGVDEASTSPRSSITAREPATMYLRTLLWPAFVFLLYAALALFPWVTVCILSKRPLRMVKSYNSPRPETFTPEHWYAVSEKYFKVAQILQPIATLVTIPITTAISSMACVVYMQSGSLRQSLTLSQTMALADSGWLSLRVWSKIKAVGSLPLYVAFALTLFGATGQILQNTLVSRVTILASSRYPQSTYVYDTLNLINDTYDSERGSRMIDFSRRAIALRSLFESPFASDNDVNNWGIPYELDDGSIYSYRNSRKKDAGHTHVPLVKNFSTGAFPLPQFVPRINSSLVYENITKAAFDQNCRNETENGGFYARYYYVEPSSIRENTYYNTEVDFEVCMTNDLRISPWNSKSRTDDIPSLTYTNYIPANSVTRDRQDISEELYLRTIDDNNNTYWKITSSTSLGYFELPSARNDGIPGPLLDKDPFVNDKTQIRANRLENYNSTYLTERAENISYSGNATLALSGFSKGPLASVAIALFGPHSFVGTRMSSPSNFVLSLDPEPDYLSYTSYQDCVYNQPLANWIGRIGLNCFTSFGSKDEKSIVRQVSRTLDMFTEYRIEDTKVALSHALYMANKLWLNQPIDDYSYNNVQLRVYYDEGIPTAKPEISNAGIIVGSLFLALHLMGLLMLTIYVVLMKPWSDRMGSEIMLKMGMVYSDELARSETKHQWKMAVTKLPGFVGDERPEEAVGQLRLGAAASLSRVADKRFEALR